MSLPAPEHLSVAERAVWTETIAVIGVELTPTIRATLEAYCVERARQLASEQFLHQRGLVGQEPEGPISIGRVSHGRFLNTNTLFPLGFPL